MAKKTTKKPVDQRLTVEYYNKYRDGLYQEALTEVVSKLSKGFMDYRNLNKKINEKRCQAIERSLPKARAFNDNGDVTAYVYVKEIHYSREGLVIMFEHEVDDRVTGSYSRYTESAVVTYRTDNWMSFRGRPTVNWLISHCLSKMVEDLEDDFNYALKGAGLAPSTGSVWEYDED